MTRPQNGGRGGGAYSRGGTYSKGALIRGGALIQGFTVPQSVDNNEANRYLTFGYCLQTSLLMSVMLKLFSVIDLEKQAGVDFDPIAL